MGVTTCCLSAVLLTIGLQLVTGESPQLNFARTIDEVLMMNNQARTARKMSRSMSTDIHDGLDMVLTPKQFARLYSGVKSRGDGHTIATPWTDGIIPYEIEENDFNAEQLDWIHRAMRHWQEVTCVRFRPATSSDVNKILVHTGHDGCWAHLGMKGGTQEVYLNRNCFWKGTIEHEFGHTLGLIHEHQRPSRDGHIKVDYFSVKKIYIDQVTKYARNSDDKMGVPYDFDSVMHYGKGAFSGSYKQTFYPRDPSKTDVIGMIMKPSFLDAKLVNLMYRCAEKNGCTNTCPSDCYRTAECGCKCKTDSNFVEPCQDAHDSCPQRAQDGDCNENTVFMHTKCRKSCGLCKTDGSEPYLTCANSDPRCQQWADEGECDSNPNYMHRSCPLACGDCTPGDRYSTPGPCRDTEGSCGQLAAEGQCDRDPHYMLRNCTKSCDFCPEDLGKDPSMGPGCVDYDSVCEYRAHSGLCHKYYAMMNTDCRKACGNCNGNVTIPADCVDSDSSCSEWAYMGECDFNPGYMLSSCQRACSSCPNLNRPEKCMDYDLDCPGWADHGECDFNPTWMGNNCPKSCFVCTEDGSKPPERVCKDYDTMCPQWASEGECDANPNWMHGHCKKSCNKCPTSSGGTTDRPSHTTPVAQGDCKDDEDQCPGWANNGECTKNPGFMLLHCKRSCGKCDGGGPSVTTPSASHTTPDISGGGCVDENDNCPGWADYGECEKNPGYMSSYCKKSCNMCGGGGGPTNPRPTQTTPGGDCVDENSNCPDWADYGECEKNPGYMTIHCKKSCHACGGGGGPTNPRPTQTTPGGDCVDKNENCPEWAKYGHCRANPSYMLNNCKKSCNECGGSNSGNRPVSDCADFTDSCKGWANSGECDKNPGYMHTSCKQSCGLC